MCKGLKFRLGARVAKEVGNGCWAQHCLFKKSIWSSKLLFLFQLCDNFKGLEKSNKMVLMMHSKQSIFEKFQGNTFLGGSRDACSGHRAFLLLGFCIFIVLEGRKQCRNVFRALSISSTEMNSSLQAIANCRSLQSFFLFFFFSFSF